jgi:diaminohydroxyphosphoribosylaminopyrimidine deaminase/5-amino-6-(5-phosphoribosylamino)uracil reductase
VLGRRGLISLLVEGGAETHGSFLERGLVNKVYAYIAPKLIGGSAAPGPFGGVGVARLVDSVRLHEVEVARLGEDLQITGYSDVHGHS